MFYSGRVEQINNSYESTGDATIRDVLTLNKVMHLQVHVNFGTEYDKVNGEYKKGIHTHVYITCKHTLHFSMYI